MRICKVADRRRRPRSIIRDDETLLYVEVRHLIRVIIG